MSFYDAIRVGASGAADFEIERSLRFNDDDTPWLQRTVSSTSNRKTFTFSCWFKKTETANTYSGNNAHMLFYQGDTVGNEMFMMHTNTNDQLEILQYDYPSNQGHLITNRRFRDLTAWYHIVLRIDTTNSTADDRFRLYINGEQETSFGTRNNPSQNQDTWVNHTTFLQYVGKAGYNNLYMDGYLAEINFVDGSSLAPSSFAETNSDTGQWVPIDTSGLTFGTNGFRLKFADNSGTTATTLGKDSSGNGNNLTPNNFATTDALPDTPTNNFNVLNILDNNTSEASPHFAYTEGNLKASWSFTGTNFDRAYGTLLIEPGDTNKYYWEATGTQNNEQMQWGVVATDTAAYRQNNRNTNPTKEANIAIAMWQPYTDNGIYAIDNSGGTYGDKLTLSNGAPANGDIFSFVYDAGAGKFYVFFKGVEPTGQNYSAGTTLFDTLDTSKTYAIHSLQGDGGVSTKSGNFVMNFGQDSSFAGAKTAQGNKDASGIGDFYYSVPSGAKALCTKNLPDPTILLPNKHFETLIYAGNSTNNRSITGLEFKPDWLWFKKRDGSSNMSHYLVRSLREYTDVGTGNGNNGAFISGTNSDQAEGETSDGGFESFDSNGFTLGKGNNDAESGNAAYERNNRSSGNYVVWAWDAGETDSATYTVKVVSDSGNKYRFNDFGSSAVTLDLAEGGTYTFDQSDSSMSSHPMQLSTTANGTHGGGSAYSTGVTYQLDGATVTASAFISGFSSASSRKLIITVAASAPTLYYYCYYHSGMGGAVNTNSTLGSSNFDGTTQAVVKANPTAGFSMVQYAGNGTNSSTVGHGLGVTPDAVIIKRRNGSDGSWIFESPHSYNGYGMYLDSTNGSNTAGSDTTSRSATLVTFVNSSDTNRRVNINGETYVMYVFANVSGYSKIGKYTGNGLVNGSYNFCGFAPKFLIIKRTDNSGNWAINDIKRDINTQYGNDASVYANSSGLETTSASLNVDFLSHGFKLRSDNSSYNASGGTYLYIAFAELPYKNSRAR